MRNLFSTIHRHVSQPTTIQKQWHHSTMKPFNHITPQNITVNPIHSQFSHHRISNHFYTNIATTAAKSQHRHSYFHCKKSMLSTHPYNVYSQPSIYPILHSNSHSYSTSQQRIPIVSPLIQSRLRHNPYHSTNHPSQTSILKRYYQIDTSKNYYAQLGVTKTAAKKDIRAAYLKMAKEWHPDVHATKSEAEKTKAKSKFQAIQEAYDILSTDSTKRKYDEMRRFGGGGTYSTTTGQAQYPSNTGKSRPFTNQEYWSGFGQSGGSSHETDWERAWRRQMQQEWERMRQERSSWARQRTSEFQSSSNPFEEAYRRYPYGSQPGGGSAGGAGSGSTGPFPGFGPGGNPTRPPGFGLFSNFFSLLLGFFVFTTVIRLIGALLFGGPNRSDRNWRQEDPFYPQRGGPGSRYGGDGYPTTDRYGMPIDPEAAEKLHPGALRRDHGQYRPPPPGLVPDNDRSIPGYPSPAYRTTRHRSEPSNNQSPSIRPRYETKQERIRSQEEWMEELRQQAERRKYNEAMERAREEQFNKRTSSSYPGRMGMRSTSSSAKSGATQSGMDDMDSGGNSTNSRGGNSGGSGSRTSLGRRVGSSETPNEAYERYLNSSESKSSFWRDRGR